MAKRRRETTEKSIIKRIKQGRGANEGADYSPWHTIQDVASRGRCHRIRGWNHGRVHHLFSDLERNVFFSYEWPRPIVDIREQFPLFPLDETLWIAKKMGVRHPTDPKTKHPVVMTTDFFLTVRCDSQLIYVPRTAKYASDLLKLRVLEKLEIERRYWEARNKILRIVRNCDVSLPYVRNVRWLHKYRDPSALYPLSQDVVHEVAARLTYLVLNTHMPLRTVASACDANLGLEIGNSLAVVRHLLANRLWEVDMTKRISTYERLVLVKAPRVATYRELRLIA